MPVLVRRQKQSVTDPLVGDSERGIHPLPLAPWPDTIHVAADHVPMLSPVAMV
jgi:hypothetical protein